MTNQLANFSRVENVGLIDSVVRASLGTAVLLSVLLIPAISSTLLVTLTLIAFYAGLTAFISWDPLYALVRGSLHQPADGNSEAPVGVEPVGDKQGDRYGHHKKAA